ncbi:hypothetical protein ACHQM5_001192 [Ranunculus cassubicifolius]
MLALIAVHRHTAASRSAKPWRRLQQGVLEGVPITAPTNPPSKFAQTPSFRASLGQVLVEGVVGVGVGGDGFGAGGVLGVVGGDFGLGVGGVLGVLGGDTGLGDGGDFGLGEGGFEQEQSEAVTSERKRKLRVRTRATDTWLLEPISLQVSSTTNVVRKVC